MTPLAWDNPARMDRRLRERLDDMSEALEELGNPAPDRDKLRLISDRMKKRRR